MTTGLRFGCNAPAGTLTSILKRGLELRFKGPYPCFHQFPTMANLLDAKDVGWTYYYGGVGRQTNDGWNSFEAIKDVYEGPDWKRDMSTPATNILKDIAGGKLRAVSWVISPPADSDYPGYTGGPAWVSDIVKAAEKAPIWPHTAIIVVWNNADFGDTYDNAAPPQLDAMGLGFRVPLLVISPQAKRGCVSHTQYEFGSILKFIEQNWSLGSLHATDERAVSIADMLQQ